MTVSHSDVELQVHRIRWRSCRPPFWCLVICGFGVKPIGSRIALSSLAASTS